MQKSKQKPEKYHNESALSYSIVKYWNVKFDGDTKYEHAGGAPKVVFVPVCVMDEPKMKVNELTETIDLSIVLVVSI